MTQAKDKLTTEKKFIKLSVTKLDKLIIKLQKELEDKQQIIKEGDLVQKKLLKITDEKDSRSGVPIRSAEMGDVESKRTNSNSP